MYYVVGSGPSGVMCAQALLEAGREVMMIDAGRQLEPDRLRTVRSLGSQRPEQWDPEQVERIRGPAPAGLSAVDLKRLYGSEYPYAFDQLEASFEQRNTKCMVSLARGGLSTVWGAGMLPYTDADFEGWPVGLSEMVPYYREVAKLVPVAGGRDRLEELYPYYGGPPGELELSRQATYLLHRMTRNDAKLRRRGYTIGQSRLAVRTADEKGMVGCRYCGLCHVGCPYTAIYSSSQTLDAMHDRTGFSYRPGLLAVRVEEHGREGVTIHCRTDDDVRRTTQLRGQRVFVACGALSSLRLIADSIGRSEIDLTMPYPPYLLLPMVSLYNSPGVVDERLHTLSQLFVHVDDRRISSHPIHLSLYSYNDLMRAALEATFGRPRVLYALLKRLFLGRLVAIQGFLHSSTASGIRVRRSSPTGRITLEAKLDPGARRSIKRLARGLLRDFRKLGLIPILPMLKFGVPGDGNHIGGVFPMKSEPRGLESDRLGRPGPLSRTHVVDSAIFTTVPAASPTYTIMANAYRIGVEAAELD